MDKYFYETSLKQLEKDFNAAKWNLAIEYADSNSIASKGDLVTDHIGTVKVEVVKVSVMGSLPACIYQGHCYTAKGEPFKKKKIRNVWQGNVEKVNGEPLEGDK